MAKHHWNFLAKVVKVIDGDTVKFNIDMGFYNYTILNLRLARIDAPEKRKGEVPGYASKEWLEKLLEGHDEVLLNTFKHGKYRWVCEIFLKDEAGEYNVNVSDELVKAGHAVYREY